MSIADVHATLTQVVAEADHLQALLRELESAARDRGEAESEVRMGYIGTKVLRIAERIDQAAALLGKQCP